MSAVAPVIIQRLYLLFREGRTEILYITYNTPPTLLHGLLHSLAEDTAFTACKADDLHMRHSHPLFIIHSTEPSNAARQPSAACCYSPSGNRTYSYNILFLFSTSVQHKHHRTCIHIFIAAFTLGSNLEHSCTSLIQQIEQNEPSNGLTHLRQKTLCIDDQLAPAAISLTDITMKQISQCCYDPGQKCSHTQEQLKTRCCKMRKKLR